jgi:hypothetical protein
MSYYQQSPYQQPWPAQSSGPRRSAEMLSPHDAEKSRRWRPWERAHLSAGGRPALGRVYAPNDFELRAMR